MRNFALSCAVLPDLRHNCARLTTVRPMTSRANAKANHKGAEPLPVPPPASNPYSPSVPISLYREVANELQMTKTQLDSLKLQNQELNQQNQKLRIEIERTVQSALRLRQVADSRPVGTDTPSESPFPGVELYFDAAPVPVSPATSGETEPTPPVPASSTPTRLHTEQRPPQRRSMRTEKSSELGGWWLMLAILLIVVTAFGTGFLIVRPLLPHR